MNQFLKIKKKKEKFKDATREQVCSLIGGFFLLRFINPAVVTPQAFMHVDTKLSANTRRNLTLVFPLDGFFLNT